jgi:transketolase
MKNNYLNTNDTRLKILKLLYKSKASHLGSNMSVVEILTAIYSLIDIDKIKINSPDRSRVFISKGHCACATYSVMNSFGLIDDETLSTYHSNNSLLAGHVSHSVEGVEHSTGALGHGVSVALGAAIGLKSKKYEKNPLVFTLCGDGEIQEGSVWEAFMLAGHLKLNNFIVLIDYNKISSITNTNKVVNLEPLDKKFLSFGFNCVEVDGHNINSIYNEIINKANDKPLSIICHTVKGKGVSFAENDPIWHYRTLTDELYQKAVNELKNN